MNASHKTRLIAKGLYYLAIVQDMPINDDSSEARVARWQWREWQRKYPQWVDFVTEEQIRLFDRINSQL